MPYKVVFVEDEIVTREGIRDNVDWPANGFEFCGEAPDGEMALPLLETVKPDVLITDIKMPFMDGLQLCKIVRERMPWVKIIILSGHDEFDYAQAAIKLGVTEYLLKPVTVQDMHQVLRKVAAQLEHERKQQQDLRQLEDQVKQSQAALRESLLLQLAAGALSAAEAIEKSQALGLDIVARCYLVVVIRIVLCDPAEPFDYREYRRVRLIIAGLVENNPDVFLLNKDMEELVLIMKGNTPEYLEEERRFLVGLVEQQVRQTTCQLAIGVGSSKQRIADIYQSFVEALISAQNLAGGRAAGPHDQVDRAELLKVDKSAVEDYLRCGVREDFDSFFDAFIRPLGEAVFRSSMIKNYVFIDLVLTTARFVNELGGEVSQVVPSLDQVESALANLTTLDQIKDQISRILLDALAFRDSQTNQHHARMARQARDYIDLHYMDQTISLSQVAAHVNHSPSYFSVVFGQQVGQTFKEYLVQVRLKKAKELLRATSLKSSEIAYQVGYGDPHYFSYMFRKNTGLTPTEFRAQTQTEP